MELVPGQLPWWVAGPGIGLCVVALYALAGVKLGVSGGWLQVLLAVERRPIQEPWRLWFLGGLVVGSALASTAGTTGVEGYGALGDALSLPVLLLVLAGCGVLIGYGARWAGGCTSGHGISGCAAGSPESIATTATFFGVAVGVTLVVNRLTGGAV